MKKGRISKAESQWYGSKEHFETEKSYEEHLKDLKKKKLKGLGLFKRW